MDKITIDVKDLSKISDGYHTIEELYDHRCLLWLNLCLANPKECFLKLDHYEGWFLIGMFKEAGKQISYHCPNKYLYYVKGNIKEDDSVEWDGHSPNNVICRLESLLSENKLKENK